MADTRCTLRVLLSNGETRDLAVSNTPEEAGARLLDLENGQREFANAWVRTNDGRTVATAHIVEASVVPLD
jgi:hypothetical protein